MVIQSLVIEVPFNISLNCNGFEINSGFFYWIICAQSGPFLGFRINYLPYIILVRGGGE